MVRRTRLVEATSAALLTLSLMALPGPASATFPGTNGKIVYVCFDPEPDICTINPDASEFDQLTNNSRIDGAPAFSSDGEQIAFFRGFPCASGAGTCGDIYRMNADGTGVRRLTKTADRNEIEPAWSPNGRQIAFTLFNAGTQRGKILVMRASDGTVLRNLGRGSFPDWLDDLIVFEGYQNHHVAKMPANDGTPKTKLTTGSEDHMVPNWSPDGSLIAWARAGTTLDIYTMENDGDNPQLLVASSEADTGCPFYPAWSPDGTMIAFADLEFCQPGGIYVMDASGEAEPDRIADGTMPNWGPAQA